ncbi:PLP-dependent cysteine synthase family protein [Ideonella sp.]|uniref:PLP-dependent cysteine synthase family protein n=1 Tax=Ideonella sp. TaxID=1929293 RepID=UPI002B4A9359|nr:PLP-dependent cysteine synthase family protein [Ideonella sp.]HJV68536.1 PLP-dependent cysteine synthase family protein [Ideonella sp.]
MTRTWVATALQRIEADARRSADTHLIPLPLPEYPGVDVYLKDESTHPSGSLKHRLARSLFLYGLCNGHIGPGTTIVESSSGSTAISEAYFARLLGLPFVAVVPRGTAAAKLAEIAFFGGRCVEVEPGEVYAEAERIARDCGGHYMDQFTYAERATDWRGNNNIAESIFSQLRHEPHLLPRWIVVGAGTGGTSATIGRYIRYRRDALATTQLVVVDPEHSVFFDAFAQGRGDLRSTQRGRIEGIGRPRVEPSFVPTVIDRMLRVPDARSFAAALALSARLGRRVGPSSGTNLAGVLQLAREMAERGERGSIVSLICDAGERYADTLFDPAWQRAQGLDAEAIDATWRAAPPLAGAARAGAAGVGQSRP